MSGGTLLSRQIKYGCSYFQPRRGARVYWRISVWGDEMTSSSLWEKHPQSYQGRALLPGFSLSYSITRLLRAPEPTLPLQSSTRGSRNSSVSTLVNAGLHGSVDMSMGREIPGFSGCICYSWWVTSHLIFLTCEKGQS